MGEPGIPGVGRELAAPRNARPAGSVDPVDDGAVHKKAHGLGRTARKAFDNALGPGILDVDRVRQLGAIARGDGGLGPDDRETAARWASSQG